MQLSEDYAPAIRTLDDGTQVQLTPDLTNSQVYLWWEKNSYNTYYLDADNRGCSSCHQEGLGKLMDEELAWRHLPVMNGFGTEIDARDCRMCHNEYSYDIYGAFMFGTERSFGQLIHGIHRGDSFTGDCMSCHAATADGNGMRLWEDAKYEILGGINQVENVQGDFSYEQDIAIGNNLALANWGNSFDEPWNKAFTDEEIPQETRDNWEIHRVWHGGRALHDYAWRTNQRGAQPKVLRKAPLHHQQPQRRDAHEFRSHGHSAELGA